MNCFFNKRFYTPASYTPTHLKATRANIINSITLVPRVQGKNRNIPENLTISIDR